jgi:hypothetical protein
MGIEGRRLAVVHENVRDQDDMSVPPAVVFKEVFA